MLKLSLDLLTGHKGEKAFKVDRKALLIESYDISMFKVKVS